MFNRRFGALIAAAASLSCSGASQSVLAAAPQRGWAHEGKVVDLPLNGKSKVVRNPLDAILIEEAFSRWGIAYDEGRLDVIDSLFTDDAEFRVLLGSATPIVAASGKAQILQTVKSTMAQQGDQRRHVISNIVIDQQTANRVSAIAYAVVAIPDDQPLIGATVIYTANLVKTQGVWRFTRFVIGMDAYAGTPPNSAK